jgi:hypothetical protein
MKWLSICKERRQGEVIWGDLDEESCIWYISQKPVVGLFLLPHGPIVWLEQDLSYCMFDKPIYLTLGEHMGSHPVGSI